MNGIGIDWVALLILGVAWVFSTVKSIPLYARHLIFALACLAIAGLRVARGVQGLGVIIAGIAVVFGVQYLIKARQAYRQATAPRE